MNWILKMAWRDSRGSRRRLLLFVAAMVLGVAALVAINAFGENLRRAVDEEARTLLGADLSFEADLPFPPEVEALADSLGGRQARRVSFSSMAYFPRLNTARLATVRAHEGAYPFYGTVETDPPGAAHTYREGRQALVDRNLMQQLGLAVGDSVRVGRVTYRIAGQLLRTPRESEVAMLFSPRIYIPLAGIDTTLLGRGSRAEYEIYFRFDDGRDVEALGDDLRPRLRRADIGVDTVGEVQADWDEGLTNLYRFLSLVGFMALLLGSVGVASAVHVYVRQRIETVAVLRCFGARAWRTFGVYLVQALAMGLIGAVTGCLLGLAVQGLLPRVLAGFLPVAVPFSVSWSALALGLGVGTGVTVLFALLPLLGVRNVSPLRALRSAYEPERPGRRDPLRWVVFGLLACGITGFAVTQAPNTLTGVGYAAALALVFGLLAGVARLIIVLVRRYFPSSWPYVWRQGLANLYRPNNQTLLLMLALGFGTFLIMTLFLTQQTLVRQIELAGGEGRPNLVFFDIQPDQVDGLTALLQQKRLPVLDAVPIVTMRIHAVGGRTLDELRADSTARVTWAHRREYRSTYRDALTDSETLVAGEFIGEVPPGETVVPVSVEEDIAGDLGVALGDTVVFDVQGVQVPTRIASIRQVEWRRMQTNFFFVFPRGVLEKAPQFFVVLTRTPDEASSAAAQTAVVQDFPNVSAIDLSLILDVFDAIFGRIAFVLRFMALFSILTGLIVLAAAVLVSRFQRVEETVLLKTLGASRRQVFRIMAVEYLFLGLFATLTGLVLALGGGWALAFFVFETPFVAPPAALAVALLVVTGLTLAVGLLNSRGIYDRSALEVLRAET
ncbi:MAG: permease [Rhodothermaceae bacterium]|nr:MAG: permease [Rhodothermaceae bacterium]